MSTTKHHTADRPDKVIPGSNGDNSPAFDALSKHLAKKGVRGSTHAKLKDAGMSDEELNEFLHAIGGDNQD